MMPDFDPNIARQLLPFVLCIDFGMIIGAVLGADAARDKSNRKSRAENAELRMRLFAGRCREAEREVLDAFEGRRS